MRLAKRSSEWWIIVSSFVVIYYGCLKIVSAHKEVESNKGGSQLEESQNRQFLCCARHEKSSAVGQDMSGEIVQIDIGQCRKLCPRQVHDDPGDLSKPAVLKCSQNRHCHPRSAKMERISTIEGIRVIETVDACECSSVHFCKRKPYNILFYGGTSYQIEIDVGMCMGFCDRELGCKPTKNRTVSINGPNGYELYHIIDKCGCVSDCYRIDHMETILDYSALEIKEGINTSDVKPVIRQINVGRCVGVCQGNITETCLLRDRKNPSRCFAGVYSTQGNCTPAKFKLHEYRTRRGSKRDIIQITDCACI